ncbi:Pyrimidine reductase, riboflavin biosynthesis [Lactobacillus plantarum JDM1] [Lactiplantibacillus mudanjiangensis]|uniref:bifunctional diaminohydroxyphosphoribosylaminopyrimidine deaminase/5-amino-6-(5-phosphoribosylamino)uracil reductase RibD n=1 Tax=Lactiplantibacillus mudanjiangensis TaxID=1296538 RepID=UPI0010142A5D|nr:Pyrimidine reductase, riboflavin biosynthesis [Lactobacillus plantarum JDM1] [Lactiplantibacillus mudanjiangensis]
MIATEAMRLAIAQARLGGVATYTNPQVGAVLVKDDRVIAVGYHHHFGGDHAEVDVLKQVSAAVAKGATLIVTLEPCSHFGKTPPCCRRVVAAGIAKVVIGQLDPHPVVAGRGRDYLVAHGVIVETGCLTAQVKALNPHYNWFYTHQRPWITLKAALTLDGKVNAQAGQRSLISNQAAYVDSQGLRSQSQAILIGERTLTTDDPALTVRLQALAHPPVRLILLHTSEVAVDRQVAQGGVIPTYLLCRQGSTSDGLLARRANVHVLVDDWTPTKISNWCAQQGWQSLLVEGGSHVQASFAAAGLVDEVIWYLAPTLFGGTALPAIQGPTKPQALAFQAPVVTPLGDNLKVQWQRKVVD